jgi:hypothetical protein
MEIQVDTGSKINSLKRSNKITRRRPILRKKNCMKKIYFDYKSTKIKILKFLIQTRINE